MTGDWPTAIERVLRHERTIVLVGMGALVALAWLYIWRGAGMGMSALDMTGLSLFPHRQVGMEGSMEAAWSIVILMWWVMMIAMMTPSAAPLVLLYLRVLRNRSMPSANTFGLATMLLLGYLTVWLAFSIAAAALQKELEPAGLISEMMLWSRSAVLSATVLGAAGLYQFSVLKHACLAQCRAPARFLTEHWRPGLLGSFALGMRHGAYCVGCCWLLMALLFVGGIMNLVWISALTLLVLAEKVLPAGPVLGRISGGVLVLWALATLMV
jgi:predicted metal-binding membrane protein